MKLQYKLRFNPDCRESKPSLYVWNYDDPRPVGIRRFGSLEEADVCLAAMGLEKGEARRADSFEYKGVEYRNAMYWEVRPCS